ncbi:MAG TPA: dimethylamine corrinoid protein 3 [Clostridiales bacterium]|nr:dimethylamine corrinoid protein 3 [Clostridiales bacterium]
MKIESGQEKLLEKGYSSLVSVDEDGTLEVVREWIKMDFDPLTLLNKLADAMTEVGARFEKMEYYLPQVMIAADIMDAASKKLASKMSAAGETATYTGTVVIGTIEGDIHDLGKNIVAGMLKASGFKVINLGRDVPVSKMVASAIENKADIVAGSALMTSTMPYLGDVVKRLHDMGVRDQCKVMVGGAPINQEYADKIGADAYAYNALEAVEKAKKMLLK